jgi:hypothetical protein
MKNPDKYIRKAFLDALQPLNYSVYDKRVPKTLSPLQYIILSSQTNVDNQLGRACRVQDCTIVLDLFVLQSLSYVSSAAIDDMLEQVLNAVNHTSIHVPYFQLNLIERDGTPRDLSFDTDTQSILRKVVTYRLEIEELTHVTP